jgi:hypothetical protein
MVRKDDQKRREGRRIACGRSSGIGGFLKTSKENARRQIEEDWRVSKQRVVVWKCRTEYGR